MVTTGELVPQQPVLNKLCFPQSIWKMEELLQAIKTNSNYTQTLQRKKKSNRIKEKHSSQSIPCLYAGLPAARKGTLSKKLTPTPLEPQPRWLSAPYFTLCLGCLTHLIKSIASVPLQPFPCLSLLQRQDNVQNTFQTEWFNMENVQFIQKERF